MGVDAKRVCRTVKEIKGEEAKVYMGERGKRRGITAQVSLDLADCIRTEPKW